MNNTLSRKISIVFLLLLVVGMVLSACGEEATTPAPTAPPAETEAAPPPGATPDPNMPVAVVPTPAPGEPTATAKFNTTIYGGPGENYVVYGAFVGSQTALVTGKSEDGQWWAISVPVSPDGNGWVNAGWVIVANADNVPVLPAPPVPPTVEIVPPGPEDPQAVAIANVFVRTGPGTDYPAFGIAPVGTMARVIGVSEDGQWWVVRINPEVVGVGFGWVMAEYTQASNVDGIQTIATPPSPAAVAPAPPPAGVPVATAVNFVNVRTGPGTNYLVLGVASPGASAEVSGRSADSAWWQVRIPTQYTSTGFGWVSASFVTTQGTESVPVVAAPPPPETVPPAPPPSSTTGCLLVAQNPVDGTVFSPGTSFSTSWTLQNAGTESWVTGEYDIAFAGAVNNVYLHQGADLYDLSSGVAPGGTYNFAVPMIAPFDPGVYGELWQVILGNQPVCQFYVYIEVR